MLGFRTVIITSLRCSPWLPRPATRTLWIPYSVRRSSEYVCGNELVRRNRRLQHSRVRVRGRDSRQTRMKEDPACQTEEAGETRCDTDIAMLYDYRNELHIAGCVICKAVLQKAARQCIIMARSSRRNCLK